MIVVQRLNGDNQIFVVMYGWGNLDIFVGYDKNTRHAT